MGELTSIGYRSGTSFVHRLDPRARLAAMAMLSLSVMMSDLVHLLPLSLFAVFLTRVVGLRWHSLWRDLRWFMLLLAAVFLARALAETGPSVVPSMSFLPGKEGLLHGTRVCWRLLTVVLFGVVLIATTSSRQVRAALEWFFRPVPLIDGRQAAVMIGLMLRFVPQILQEAARTADAQRARCVERRRNPVVRLKMFAIPFLRRASEDADRIAIAMDARGFTTRGAVSFTGRFAIRDWAVVVGSIAVFLTIRFHR